MMLVCCRQNMHPNCLNANANFRYITWYNFCYFWCYCPSPPYLLHVPGYVLNAIIFTAVDVFMCLRASVATCPPAHVHVKVQICVSVSSVTCRS